LGASRLLIEYGNKVHPTGSNHPSRNASFVQNASGNKANASSASSNSDDKEKAEDGPAKQGKSSIS
jgi:hypothetical protein